MPGLTSFRSPGLVVRATGAAQVQRAKADVSYSVAGGETYGVEGENKGKGGRGGIDHSEQGVWDKTKVKIKNLLGRGSSVSVTFVVDTTICKDCSPWFEDVVYPELGAPANAGGTTCTLEVEVGNNRITVEGDRTIWPPEIADVPTFKRLSMMERSMRYPGENRDEEGGVKKEINPYAVDQIARLTKLLKKYGHSGLTPDAIEEEMDRARDYVVGRQQVWFDEDKAKETLSSYLQKKTFSEIVGAGGFTLPLPPDIGNPNDLVVSWLRLLNISFVGWMESSVEDHFEGYEHREDIEYG